MIRVNFLFLWSDSRSAAATFGAARNSEFHLEGRRMAQHFIFQHCPPPLVFFSSVAECAISGLRGISFPRHRLHRCKTTQRGGKTGGGWSDLPRAARAADLHR
jgi:hypothetical protein